MEQPTSPREGLTVRATDLRREDIVLHLGLTPRKIKSRPKRLPDGVLIIFEDNGTAIYPEDTDVQISREHEGPVQLP